MRDRLAVTHQIQLAELLVGVPFVAVWAVVLFGWPGDDVTWPFLVAAGAGVAVTQLGNPLVDRLLPDRPRTYRRPWKAAAFAFFVVVALVVGIILGHPLGTDTSARHQLMLVLLVCFAASVAFLVWPPIVDVPDVPTGSATGTEPPAGQAAEGPTV